eukprot:evm.model.NODE_599_length_13732_cov_29.858433.3
MLLRKHCHGVSLLAIYLSFSTAFVSVRPVTSSTSNGPRIVPPSTTPKSALPPLPHYSTPTDSPNTPSTLGLPLRGRGGAAFAFLTPSKPNRLVAWLQTFAPGPDAPRAKKLDWEFLRIAAPAFVQFTAEPLAGLVDTAYLGRLGPVALGGVGVAISAQYSVSKLYNDPLLRTSISLVASSEGSGGADNEEDKAEALSRSVSTALLLAGVVGLLQGIVYVFCAAPIIRAMGVLPGSEMYVPAVSYLRIRALGTPAATLWLVSNGIFRGLGDTLTPLKWSIIFTLLNAALDPLCMFTFGMGPSGAAMGTAIAQYVALLPLLLKVRQRARVRIDLADLLPSLGQYLRAASLVFVRTWGKILAYAYCARQAALLGVVGAAAYNLTFQVGFATTQLCESIAIAVQSLIARELGVLRAAAMASPSGAAGSGEMVEARTNLWHLIKRGCLLGAVVSGGLSVVTLFSKTSVLTGLTSDKAVQAAALSVFPMVMACQVNKGLAYPVNGIIMGGLDWGFSTMTMWMANIVCIGMLLLLRPNVGLSQLWAALSVFMGIQWVSGVVRFLSGTGVWGLLRRQQGVVGGGEKKR